MVAAASAAAVASSLFLSRPVLAEDQCRSSVVGKAAPRANEVKYTDRLESVTLFVDTDKADQSLAITVPGEVVARAKDSAGVSELLLANEKVAIKRYLEGKTSSEWECVTLPAKAEAYAPVPETPAPAAAGWTINVPVKPPAAPQPAETTKPPAPKLSEAEEAAERAVTSSVGVAQDEIASSAKDNGFADKSLARGKLKDKALDKVRGAVQRRENAVLRAMYPVMDQHIIMPAYRHWKAAHNMLAKETVSKDELSAANDHLKAAEKELEPDSLKRRPEKRQADKEDGDARDDIRTTYDERGKKERADKLTAELTRVKKYVEAVYAKYPKSEQAKSDKSELLKEPDPQKMERKAKKREIVASKKSYTAKGEGDSIADEEALAEAITKVHDRLLTRDNDLKFNCAIDAQIKVNRNGHAAEVTFLKGPTGYLGNEDFLQQLANIIGRMDEPGKANTTYTRPLTFF